MNIVKRIVSANAGRDPQRLAMKYQAMRANAFVFLRGTCHLFYDRLPKRGIFAAAPLTWCCGDLHLENFGSYKGNNRLAYFDLNDFDEAALAPATWDLARMVTSILVSAHAYRLTGSQVHGLASAFLFTYREALASGKASWVERETATGMVKALLEQVRARNRTTFLNSRTRKSGGHRRFRLDGKKTLPVSDAQRAQVMSFMTIFAQQQRHPEFYQVRDVARRIAGTGSLGIDRYAILVEGKGSPDGNYLLDLKAALPSSIARHLNAIQPVWAGEAERVVALQDRMQAVTAAFLQPVTMGTHSYVLRALQPVEDRVPIARHHAQVDDLQGVIRTMGQCVAWAHLRSAGRQQSATADALIAWSTKPKWPKKLLTASEVLAGQVYADWQCFQAAYDRGTFRTTPTA